MSGTIYDLAKLKPLIRSMVMSHRNQSMAVDELERDFKAIEGFTIPYKQLGYTNLFNLLHSMPDIVQVKLRNGYPIVTYVTTAAVEHVEHLIQRNKRGRNKHVRLDYSPKIYPQPPQSTVTRIEPVRTRHHSEMVQTSPTTMSSSEKTHQTKPVMKDANEQSNERRAQILSTENQPPVVEQVLAAEYHSPAVEQVLATNNQPRAVRQALAAKTQPLAVGQALAIKKPPPAVEQVFAAENQPYCAKETYEGLNETCEHVGTMMGWKPSTDEWDIVNMMGLSPNVMQFGSTIPKPKLSRYFEVNAEVPVRIQHIFNPNRIWLRSMKQDLIINRLTKELNHSYGLIKTDDWDLEPSQVQYGLYCAVQMDGNWYRARIVGPLIGSVAKLFFIDTGLVENVNYRHIKFLFDMFSSVPAQAIRASLACLIPKEMAWTRAESDHLATLIASYGEKPLSALTFSINYKHAVVDIVLIDDMRNNLCETFAAKINARWTGAFYLPLEKVITNLIYLQIPQREMYLKKRPSFNEKLPSFYCLEEGHFPTLEELRHFQMRSFDYEEYYTRMPHFEKNGVVEKIGRETNEILVKLHGIVSVKEAEEMQLDRTSRVGERVEQFVV
ncbi:uncharacterized protein LOC126566006 [Anopheles maculipalpis]|uniref:uncharacterized protein LOC126566006 n=1 Tax=Anopheles maculipalpis TaxID=1496333 RepID=UPI0021590111|nr:uncharacterized protein LOC126566006 [Anopheles maculipalpis]